MDANTSIALLEEFKGEKIKDVYDEPGVADALMALNPKFEYPDWDGKNFSANTRKGQS
jgi:hypothetical protein